MDTRTAPETIEKKLDNKDNKVDKNVYKNYTKKKTTGAYKIKNIDVYDEAFDKYRD